MAVTFRPSSSLLRLASPASQRAARNEKYTAVLLVTGAPYASTLRRQGRRRILRQAARGKRVQPVVYLRQLKVRWHSAVAGHMSCMVHTTGLPESSILAMPPSESMPWLTHCKWITSASLNSRVLVIVGSGIAMSISKRCLREKPEWQNMHHRSHRKASFLNGPPPSLATLGRR